MNKKAIMMQFLVTVLLAIIIFVPACMITSKLFTLSTQASDNFGAFVNDVKNFDSAVANTHKSTTLILDQGTAIAYFEPSVSNVTVDVDGELLKDYTVVFFKPSDCAKDKACLCLIRTSSVDVIGTRALGLFTIMGISPKRVVCVSNTPPLSMANCGIGTPKGVKSYTCKNGFVIERLLISQADEKIGEGPATHFEAERRVQIQLSREKDNILLRYITMQNTVIT